MRDAVSRELERRLSGAFEIAQAAVKAAKRNQRKASPVAPLDEKEQRRKKMLKDGTPLPGQMELFADQPTMEGVSER